MPLTIPLNSAVDYFVSAKAFPSLQGGVLTARQGCEIKSSDLGTVSITGDASPRSAPDGTPSLASGKVTVSKAGSVTLTATIRNLPNQSAATNADGSAISPATDTVVGDTSATRATGSLFGTAA